jgi:hypothetical protein
MVALRLLIASTAVAGVASHGYMSVPAPRARTVAGHPFASDPQSDGTRNADCRDPGIGEPQLTWVQGQEIEVEVTITANHQGWHELRFCQDPSGTNACLEQTLAIAVNPTSTLGCPAAAPPSSTHGGSCIPSPAESREDFPTGLGPKKSKFILPANFTGLPENDYHVEVQWWYITDNWAPEHFKSCHDVRIIPSDGKPEEPEQPEEPEEPEQPEEPEEPEEEEPVEPEEPEQPELPAYCLGEPCPTVTECRSVHGYCGPDGLGYGGPEPYCNNDSVWKPECYELADYSAFNTAA